MARTKNKRRNRKKPAVPEIAERERSGRHRRAPQGPACTAQLLQHRRQIMPGLNDAMLMTARAGVPLEMLFEAGHITKAQRDAGHQYRNDVDRWRAIKGVRDGARKPVPGSGKDIDPVIAAKITREYIAAYRVVESLSPIAQAALDTVCIEEAPSRIMSKDSLGDRLRDALRDGLTAMRSHYKIREDQEQAA